MKILNVVEALAPGYGGTVERTVQMSRFLKAAGHDVTVMTVGAVTHPSALDGSIGNVVALPLLSKRYGVPWPAIRTIARAVSDADVVHIMSHWPPINAAVYVVARWKRKPYVVSPAGSLRLFGRSQILKKLFNALVGRRMLRNADRIILITRDEEETLAPYQVDRKRVVVLTNAVEVDALLDDDTRAFRERFRLGDDPIILFLGRLNSIKGPDLLLEGFLGNELLRSTALLVFAGPDGGLLETLRKRAGTSAAADRVHFIGVVGGEWKSRALHAASVLVVSSRHEAMSLAALEAGAAGTPVVLTDQCGFDEVGHINGGMVVPVSSEAIASALARLLGDPDGAATMGRALRQYVIQHHSWTTVVSQLAELFEEIRATRR